MTEYHLRITLAELCEHTNIPSETVVEFVEHGILEPIDSTEETWVFTSEGIQITRQAIRLQQDLGINWAGVALALELLAQRESLQNENRWLKSRLKRFLLDE